MLEEGTSQRSVARVLRCAPRYGHQDTGAGTGRGVYLTRGRFSFSTFENSEPSLRYTWRPPLSGVSSGVKVGHLPRIQRFIQMDGLGTVEGG